MKTIRDMIYEYRWHMFFLVMFFSTFWAGIELKSRIFATLYFGLWFSLVIVYSVIKRL